MKKNYDIKENKTKTVQTDKTDCRLVKVYNYTENSCTHNALRSEYIIFYSINVCNLFRFFLFCSVISRSLVLSVQHYNNIFRSIQFSFQHLSNQLLMEFIRLFHMSFGCVVRKLNSIFEESTQKLVSSNVK